VVFVRDNGVGFDMAYAHKLFGVFPRCTAPTSSAAPASARQRPAHHPSPRRFDVAEGAVDRGATFLFSLPVKESYDG